jgi:hypothetical protein
MGTGERISNYCGMKCLGRGKSAMRAEIHKPSITKMYIKYEVYYRNANTREYSL